MRQLPKFNSENEDLRAHCPNIYTVNAVYGASIKSEEVKLNDHLISEVEFSFVILAGQHSMP